MHPAPAPGRQRRRGSRCRRGAKAPSAARSRSPPWCSRGVGARIEIEHELAPGEVGERHRSAAVARQAESRRFARPAGRSIAADLSRSGLSGLSAICLPFDAFQGAFCAPRIRARAGAVDSVDGSMRPRGWDRVDCDRSDGTTDEGTPEGAWRTKIGTARRSRSGSRSCIRVADGSFGRGSSRRALRRRPLFGGLSAAAGAAPDV